jgi:3-oxoacyl-[acyl-carrier protein] reductase
MEPKSNYLIFGATGGVGSALSRSLAAQGNSVFVVGRDPARTQQLADELDASHTTCDATNGEEVSACFAAATESLGKIDGVAHCVGSLLLKPGHLTTAQQWDDTIATNLTSAFHVLRAAAPGMRKSGGSLVFVSSAAARLGFANHEAIAAAKAGLIGFVLASAATYAPNGIRVNCVAPGLTDTPLVSRITSDEASLEASRRMHALGRIGRPEDVASAIQWLLSPEQTWVTGQVIGVDGGLGTIRSRP